MRQETMFLAAACDRRNKRYYTVRLLVCTLSQEQHSLQLFLGNPEHPKQLIINTLRDSVKAIPGHLEVKSVTAACLQKAKSLHNRASLPARCCSAADGRAPAAEFVSER